MAGLGSKALSDYRRNKLGFIFQFYNLVPNLTVKENIQVCQYLTKNPLDLDAAQEELLRLQMQIKEHKLPVLVLIEGWGAAGKGSTIGGIIKNIDQRR